MDRKHKKCEQCNNYFICCTNDISKCHCQQLYIDSKTSQILTQKYKDCLCPACLKKWNKNNPYPKNKDTIT